MPVNAIFRFGAAGLAAGLGLAAARGVAAEAVAPLLRSATAQTRAGEEAYLTGRVAEAVPALQEAVRLHLAAGDLPGAARALLNLALAQRAAGDAAGAAATMARLKDLTPAARQQTAEDAGREDEAAELAAASAWLEALLALDRGAAGTAAELLATVPVKLPAPSPWPGRLETLRADIALHQGRWADAAALARSGVAACAAAHDRAEEARAWRLAGAAEASRTRWNDARSAFLRALRIEEILGGGARMAGDLEQLALVSGKLGADGDADLFARRARAIRSAR